MECGRTAQKLEGQNSMINQTILQRYNKFQHVFAYRIRSWVAIRICEF